MKEEINDVLCMLINALDSEYMVYDGSDYDYDKIETY